MQAPLRPHHHLAGLSAVVIALSGCGGSPDDLDAGSTRDAEASDAGIDAAVELCARDDECDDDRFCNGAERCRPGVADADERGCVAASSPCEASQTCTEADHCVSDCGMEPDADGDGHQAIACGGDDCDDSDDEVYPGAMEVCDMAGRDEDCLPETLGPDADTDGYVSATCCNRQADGSTRCGTDCDDSNREINPDAIEVCNGLDDNCDGALDPTIEDGDGDGWARCADLPEAMRDCNDASATTYPGAAELCDGLDNNCDGSAAGEDVDEDGFMAVDVMCTGGFRMGLPRTDCDDADRGVAPDQTERCDAVDHDCDGTTDEAPSADSCPVVAETTFGCVSEACVVESCSGGLGDCDADATNGCEQPLDTIAHCGSCGAACSWECGLSGCADPVLTVAGVGHTCSLLSDQTVRCWGLNESGQLGTGVVNGSPSLRPQTRVQQRLPGLSIGTLENVVELGLGSFFSCARTSSGEVWCWGDQSFAQLGRGVTPAPESAAVAVLSGALGLAVAGVYACALQSDRTVACWGGNDSGQTGSMSDPQLHPATVAGLDNVASIAAGKRLTCALRIGGEVWCWGSNQSGGLGRGTIGGNSPVPAPVRAVSGPGNLSGVDEIAVGNAAVCARIGDEVVCWGGNGFGQLGDGTTASVLVQRERDFS